MIEFESRDMIAVIGAGQQQSRVLLILKKLGYYVAEYQTVDGLRHSGNQPYATVIVAEQLDKALISSLQFLEQSEHLVLFSQQSVEKDVIEALYGGAHFVFDSTESDFVLAARFNAALRSHGEKTLAKIIAPPYKFDVERRQVYLGNRPIALSPKEYLFAEYVFSRPDKIIPKSELMLSVWSLPRKFDARRVDTAACRVRKKMQLSSQITGWELSYQRRAGFKLSLQVM